MSKRNLPAPSSPDLIYDTDEDGQKVIIRKFDIPLPPKQGKIIVSDKKLEKWKYQHDVPEGKIFTKRVHVDVSSVISPQNEKKMTSNIPSSSISSKVTPTNIQNIQLLASAPTCKDIIVVPPKEQSSKLVAPVPRTICADKITLNNLPENVITNSIQVFDSKFVNGKKVLYLKAVKDVAKIVGTAGKGGTEVILAQNGVNTPQLKCVPLTSSTAISVINPVPVKPKELRCYYPSRAARNKIEKKDDDDDEEGTSISKPPPPPPTIPHKMKFTSREVPVGNILEHIPDVSEGCDSAPKQKDVQITKPVNPIVPTTVQHSNLHSLSLSTQKKRELQLSAETIPKLTTGIFSNVVHDVSSTRKEIALQMNSLKTNNHILIEGSKPTVNVTDGSISVVGVEFLNNVANKTSSDSGLPVENPSLVKEGKLKFVQADSTTPTIVNVCSTSVQQKTDNLSLIEPMIIINQENLEKEQINTAVSGRQILTSSLIDPNIICNQESQNSIQNIVIVNPPQNVANLNAAAIPKPNVDEIMRRRKIALKFQQDMQRAKEMPRIERTVVLPARRVNIVDSSTQTSLFCMLEPGRMVEMLLNDNSNESKITHQCNSQDQHIEMKEKSQNANERNPTFVSNVTEQYKASTNYQTAINDQINPPLSKRIRLDNIDIESGAVEGRINSYNRVMNKDPLLTSSMDFEGLIPSFESLGKENIESTNINMSSKNYQHFENDRQSNNINNISTPLSCMQSTLNRNINGIDKNAISKFVQSKERMETLVKDYRDSLIPDEDGNLPLHNAVMDRDVKQVQRQCLVLSARKKSVDVKNKMKETALHLAVLCHDLQIVKILLKFKAKPNVPDGDGNTPVHMAIIWGNSIEILQELLTYVEDNSPILNLPNDEGFSPLHLCALRNKPSEAALLVKKNVEVNIRDRKSGRTPLFHAVENGNSEISQVLLNAGAHTQVPNFSGQTALNASELTFVLDELSRKVDSPKTIKPHVVPCVCQDNTKEDRTSNMSINRNILVFESTEIDNLNSNNDIYNINLLDSVLHNR